MTLVWEWAAVLHVVVVSAVGAGALQGFKRGGGGPRPGGIAPTIRGALGSFKVWVRGGGMRGWGHGWVEDEVGDAGDDPGTEQIPFRREPLFGCSAQCFFSPSKGDLLLALLDVGGMVAGDFGHNPNVVEAGNGIVYEEALGEVWVKHGEAGIPDRVGRGLGGVWVQHVPIDAPARVDAALDGRDPFLVDIADVGAVLLPAKLI
jgi:hypothetical protein